MCIRKKAALVQFYHSSSYAVKLEYIRSFRTKQNNPSYGNLGLNIYVYNTLFTGKNVKKKKNKLMYLYNLQ